MAWPTTPYLSTGSKSSVKIVTTSKRKCSGMLHVEQPGGHRHPPLLEVDPEHSVTRVRDHVLDPGPARDPHVLTRPPEPVGDVSASLLAHFDHRGGVARSTNTRRCSRREATRTRVRSASMLRPALPISRPMSSSAIRILIAIAPPGRSKDCTCTSSRFSAM